MSTAGQMSPGVNSPPIGSPLLVIFILFAGVVGGLVLVIGVMYFCQYCVRERKRRSIRFPKLFIPLSTTAEPNLDHKSNSKLTLEDGQLFSSLQDDNTERTQFHRYEDYGGSEDVAPRKEEEDIALRHDHFHARDTKVYQVVHPFVGFGQLGRMAVDITLLRGDGEDSKEDDQHDETSQSHPPLLDYPGEEDLDHHSVSAAGTPTRSLGRTSYSRTPTLSERDGKHGKENGHGQDKGRLNIDLRGYPDGRRSKSPRTPIGPIEMRGRGSGESLSLDHPRSGSEGSRVRAQVHHRHLDETTVSLNTNQKAPPAKETDSESDIDIIVNQEKEKRRLEQTDSLESSGKSLSRPLIQFKTIGQLAMLRAPKKSTASESPKGERVEPSPAKDVHAQKDENAVNTKHPEQKASVGRKEVVVNGNGPRSARDYAELWHLRATLESKDSSEASESSEFETVISCRNTENVSSKVSGKLTPERMESFDVTDEDSCKFISTSFEQTISSVSAEDSDTSERDRNSAESGKESIRSLKQMQADSGYTSIEQKAEMLTERLDWKRRQQFAAASDHDSTSFESAHSHSMTISSDSSSPTTEKATTEKEMATSSQASHHDTRAQNKASMVRGGRRTASTKRREFISEKKEAIFDSFSFPEEEAENQDTTDSSKDALTRGSSTETYQFEAKPKLRDRVRRGGPGSMQRREARLSCYPKGRDFSIDEKTDALFKEFLRQDAMFNTPAFRRAKPTNRNRWFPPSKQHSDSVLECSEKEPAVWRAEDHRSVSLEQRSGNEQRSSNNESAKQRLTELLPRSQSRGKLMPQNSIEDDYARADQRPLNDDKRPPRLRDIKGQSTQTTTTADVHALNVPNREMRRAASENSDRELLRLDDVSSRPSAFRPVKKTLPQRSATVDSIRDTYSKSEELHTNGKDNQYTNDPQRRRERSPIVPPKILVGRCTTPDKQVSTNQQRSKSVSPRMNLTYERDPRDDSSPGSRSPRRAYSPRRFEFAKEIMDPKSPSSRRTSQPSQSPPTSKRVEEGGHISRRDRSASMQETGLLQVPRSRSGSRSQGASPRPRHRKRDITGEYLPDLDLDNVPLRANRSLELLESTRHELEKGRPYRDPPSPMRREGPIELRRSPRSSLDHEIEDRKRRERERDKQGPTGRLPVSAIHLSIDMRHDRDAMQRLSPQGRDYNDPRSSRDMDRNRDTLQRPRSRDPSRSPIRHRERFINEGRAGSESAILERRARAENARKIQRYPLRAQSTGDVLSDERERRRNGAKNWQS